MKKSHIARRRGTSVAAAALSFALVAPFAQPVAAPHTAAASFAAEAGEFVDENADTLGDANSTHNQNPQGDGWNPDPQKIDDTAWRHVYWANGGKAGATQPVRQKDGSYNVDAIASGQTTTLSDLSAIFGAGKDVVSGRAMIATPRPGAQLTATYSGMEPLADEINVYFQWMDSDGAVSPVYSAKTSNDFGGRYAFAVPQWIDAKGKKHRFRAQFNQRYQVWADPANDPETGNELIPLRQAPGMAPGAFGRGSGEALGEFPGNAGTNGNVQRTGVWMYERPYAQDDSANNFMKVGGDAYDIQDENRPQNDPNNHKAQLIHDTLGRIDKPTTHRDPNFKRTVSGKVWLENGNESQLFTGAGSAGNDPARGEAGYKVFATALTADGAQEYDSFIEGLQYFERADATKKWIEDHPQYVAGTVFGEPNENGEYTLRFPDDVFGSNAYTGAAMDQFQKHLYMWVENKDGVVVPGYSTWTQPVFQDPRYNLQWSPTVDPSHNNAFRYSRFNNVNFALVAANNAKINITNYDNTANPARRGDVAQAELKGKMPVGATVEWRNSSGKVLKKCGVIETASDMQGCETFEVPKDAVDGEFFYVALTNGEGARDISVDSFIVVVEKPQWDDVASIPSEDPVTLPNIGTQDAPRNPSYTVTEFVPKKDADGDLVKDKDGNQVYEERQLDESEYKITLDEKKLDMTFDPEFKPEDGSRYKIEVRGEYPKVDPDTKQPVYELDENGEPKRDENGEPIPVYEEEYIDDATVTYRGFSTLYEPEYPTTYYKFPKSGSWKSADIDVQFTDEDGNEVRLRDMPLKPKGEAFIVDPKDLPEGWKDVEGRSNVKNPGDFSIDRGVNDRNRGKITFIPWDNNGEENYEQVLRDQGAVKIPVKVVYEDDSVDEVIATIIYQVDETDVYDVKYGEVTAVPGEETQLTPELKHKDGSRLGTIDGAKYTIPDELPEDASDEDKAAWDEFQKALEQGYEVKVDENTGVMTVKAPKELDENTVEKFTVPVTVTYKDGSSEPAEPATVLLDSDNDGTPDVDDNDDDGDGVPDDQEKNDGTNPKDPGSYKQSSVYEPKYDETSQKPGKKVEIDPTFTKKDDNGKDSETSAPEGTKYTLGKDAQEGVEVDEKTGKVTVTVPEDANKGDEITVPVEVTYPDGSKDNVDAVVTVSDKDSDVHDPTYGDGTTVKQGEEKTIPAPKDADGTDLPADTKFTKGENGPDWATVDPETGEITVTPGTDVEPGEYTVPVEVTYPDGSKDTVDVKVKVEQGPTTVDDSNVNTVEPNDEKQDTGIKVTNKDDDTKVTAKDEDGNDVPVEIDENGNVIVTPGEDVDGPIDVTITDPDLPGGKVEVEVPVKGHEKDRDDNGSDASDKTTVDETGKNPVDPTNDPQDTGIKVTNKDDDTEVSAKDEDGKDVPVEIDENGNVIVTPGEDVDGPIDVTITDPDLPNGKVEVEVTVNGHEKNRDDNGSDPANEDGTKVDGSNITPVNPTDDKQDTGIKVTNPDNDTKVTAKDEDGNDVPVEIDENGNVVVTPGENVDGPINVTITDPDLPNGKAEFEVPVNGHEKGRDDNGSDASDKTTVDQNGKKPVDPTDKKQGTGVKVTNPDKDTKVSAKDEDGKDVPVEINPETGEIEVTPGKDVDGPITVTVEDPDLDGGKVEFEIDVNGHKKGRDDNGSGASDDKTTVSPGKSTVTPNGKGQNVGKVDQGNSDKKGELTGELVDKDGNRIKGAKVTIDKDGNIIVSVPEGTPAGEAWVVVKEDGKEIHRFKIQIGETIDTGKCVATSVGFGLPLIALLPLGLATQIEIPGLSDFAAQANAQIQNVNTQLQQQLGIFNPQLAAQVEGLNKQLGQYGTDIATVAGGLALIAAGILVGTIIYDNCTPGGGSSVKDLELKGSSGKTYAGSSKEEKAPATTQKAAPKN